MVNHSHQDHSGSSKEAEEENLKQYMNSLRPDELFDFMASYRSDNAYLKPLLQDPPTIDPQPMNNHTASNEVINQDNVLPSPPPFRSSYSEQKQPINHQKNNPQNISVLDDYVLFNPDKWSPFESDSVTKKNSPIIPVHEEENILFNPHKWNPFDVPMPLQKNNLNNMSVLQDHSSVFFNPPHRSNPLESDLLAKTQPLNLPAFQNTMLTDPYNIWNPNFPVFHNSHFLPNPNLPTYPNPPAWNPTMINALKLAMENQYSSNQNYTIRPDEMERNALAFYLMMKAGTPLNLPLEAKVPINLNMFNPYEQAALVVGKKRTNPAMWNPMADWVPVKRPNVANRGGEIGYLGDGGVLFNPSQTLPNIAWDEPGSSASGSRSRKARRDEAGPTLPNIAWDEPGSSASGSRSRRARRDEAGPSEAPPSDGPSA